MPRGRRARAAPGHPHAGRVVEVRDQVAQPRPGVAQRGAHLREVPAIRADRDADRHAPVRADRVERARVGRALHQHPVAGPRERAQREVPGVQGALRDQHLARLGRQTAAGQVRGDHRPGARQAERLVAVAAQLARELLRGHGGQCAEVGGRRQVGDREVDHVARRRGELVRAVVARLRCRGPAAGPAAGRQVALLAQHVGSRPSTISARSAAASAGYAVPPPRQSPSSRTRCGVASRRSGTTEPPAENWPC